MWVSAIVSSCSIGRVLIIPPFIEGGMSIISWGIAPTFVTVKRYGTSTTNVVSDDSIFISESLTCTATGLLFFAACVEPHAATIPISTISRVVRMYFTVVVPPMGTVTTLPIAQLPMARKLITFSIEGDGKSCVELSSHSGMMLQFLMWKGRCKR